MIAIEQISKSYGKMLVLEDISCCIDPGSMYGFIGYNGVGKTTLLKLIAGIYRPDRGEIFIQGRPVYENEAVKQQIFSLTEELYFLSQANLFHMRQFYRGYYPQWNDGLFFKLLDIFGLDPTQNISGYSKGMQRQAGLLLALSTQPRYLLLDEAFDGLDLAMRRLMSELLKQYVAKKQAIAVITSHNIRELEHSANYIGMIQDRRLLFHSSVQALKRFYHTYQFICKENITIEQLIRAFEDLPLTVNHLYQNNEHYTCVMKGEPTLARQQIAAMGAKEIQVSSVTLEEFFLPNKEQRIHDFQGIFS